MTKLEHATALRSPSQGSGAAQKMGSEKATKRLDSVRENRQIQKIATATVRGEASATKNTEKQTFRWRKEHK